MIALNTIGSARGLIAGDFFDKDGNLSGGREGNIYTQGLENQARISANQTAGVGKLGEFTREQMNAIQYGAEAGVLNQMAQGNALREVHGSRQGILLFIIDYQNFSALVLYHHKTFTTTLIFLCEIPTLKASSNGGF